MVSILSCQSQQRGRRNGKKTTQSDPLSRRRRSLYPLLLAWKPYVSEVRETPHHSTHNPSPPAIPFFPKGCHVDPLASVGFRTPRPLFTAHRAVLLLIEQRALKWWKKTRRQIITDRTTGQLLHPWLALPRIARGESRIGD